MLKSINTAIALVKRVTLTTLTAVLIYGVSGGASTLAGDWSFAPNELTKVQVTVLDTARHPVHGASFTVFDSKHHLLEDPYSSLDYSGSDGRVSYRVPKTDVYYIRGEASGYLIGSETQVISKERTISATLILKKRPPLSQLKKIKATILNTEGYPIEGATIHFFSAAHLDLYNPGSRPLWSDNQGHYHDYVPMSQAYYLETDASGYLPSETHITSQPSATPIVIVLKHRDNQKRLCCINRFALNTMP